MADDFELAKALFGKQKETKGAIKPVSGFAYSDSSDGSVEVNIDGSVVNLPTNVQVKEGDQVQIDIRDHSPVVTGVVGRGDEMAADIAAVADVSNYFWHDSSGVHVSTTDGDPAGTRNILISSLSILLRKAANTLVSITDSAVAFFDGSGNQTASFGATSAQIGETTGKNITIDADSVDINNGSALLAEFFASDGAAYIKGSNQLYMTAGGSASPKPVYLIAPPDDVYGDADDRGVGLIYPNHDNTEVKFYSNVDSVELIINGTAGTAGQVLKTGGFDSSCYWDNAPKFDIIYNTPDYYFDSGDINSTIDNVPYDPNRQGKAYNQLGNKVDGVWVDYSITDYDLLVVCFRWGTSAGAQNLTNGQLTQIIPVASIPYGTSTEISGGVKAYEFVYMYPTSSPSWYIDVAYGFLDASHIYAHRRTYSNLRYWDIYQIIGIKF